MKVSKTYNWFKTDIQQPITSLPKAILTALIVMLINLGLETFSQLIYLTEDKKVGLYYSFIPEDLYSTPPRNLLRGALSPVMAKEKCFKRLAEGRHIVPGQQAQRKLELSPSGGDNHGESSTLFKRRADPRNEELSSSRRTKGSARS